MKRYPLATFFILTFVISWSIWLPAVLAPKPSPESLDRAQLLGAFGPGLAALIVTALVAGIEGLRHLFGRLLLWRVALGWYLIALFLPTGISLLTTVLHMMIGGYAPDFSDPLIYHVPLPKSLQGFNAGTLLIPIFLQQLVLGSAVCVELGWRGFALTRLQQRFSALDASLLLALAWSLWVMPWWLSGSPATLLKSFLVVLIGAIPAQVLATWIFNSAGGSLLIAVLFNNAIKITDLFIAAPATQSVIPVAAYWAVTLLVVSAVGGARLTLRPADKPTDALGRPPV